MKTAQFIEGYRAREQGNPKSENPYLGTNKGRSVYEWNSGWSEADGDAYCKENGINNSLEIGNKKGGRRKRR